MLFKSKKYSMNLNLERQRCLRGYARCSVWVMLLSFSQYHRRIPLRQCSKQRKLRVSSVMLWALLSVQCIGKGTTNGVITDIDGNFSLKVPSDATLTISFIGYKTVELPVAGKTSFTVTLKEDSEMLDEVVVVGFGTQKKVNLTGSVGLATAKEIEARPVANATQALQGLVPGLQITTNTR